MKATKIQAGQTAALNSCPDCQPGTGVADGQHGAGGADHKSCTGVRPPQTPKSQRHLREELGRLPGHTKGPQAGWGTRVCQVVLSLWTGMKRTEAHRVKGNSIISL